MLRSTGGKRILKKNELGYDLLDVDKIDTLSGFHQIVRFTVFINKI